MKASEIGCSAKTNGINGDETASFGFNLDAHSFELLSKNLYGDNLKAVCREYTTNSLDSLKESGNEDRGYIAHLPNKMEPFFSIRDMGCGIPPEEMANLFTFNHSARRDSNVWNGMFGLGSKSFLAVSDSATFTSYYNGTKHVYFVYKDKGIPTYTKVEEVPTDEPNGLEVKIPIPDNQHYNLIETYKQFCKYVEIKPTIIGYDTAQWDAFFNDHSKKVIDLGDGCSFDPTINTYNKLTVVFGSVAYHVSRSVNGFNYRHNAVMQIPTGSVDIVPSREELRMTEKTIAYLNTLAPRFQAQVQKKIDEVYKTEGFINTCTYINTIFANNKPKINNKDQYLKLKVAQSARFNHSNVFKYSATAYETTVDMNTVVVLNFDESVSRYKARVKRALELQNNRQSHVVIVTDKDEAEKYCAHYEVDISTLKHLKDIDIPKVVRSGGIKEDRFIGIRTVNKSGEIVKKGDLDLSEIESMFFVYRKGNKIFTDDLYTQEVSNICAIFEYEPWDKATVYALTGRQYKQCEDHGIDMINLMDDVYKKYNQDEFDELVRRDVLKSKSVLVRKVSSEVLTKLLPTEFRTVVTKQLSDKKDNIHRLYKRLGYGTNIITKHESTMEAFVNSDVGKLLTILGNAYYRSPSDTFISKLMTAIVSDPEMAGEHADKCVNINP